MTEPKIPDELLKAAKEGVPAPEFIESEGWRELNLHGQEPTVATREQQDHAAIGRIIEENRHRVSETLGRLARRGKGRIL